MPDSSCKNELVAAAKLAEQKELREICDFVMREKKPKFSILQEVYLEDYFN